MNGQTLGGLTAGRAWAVYTAAQVREADRVAIEERGVPAEVLMDRAGAAAWDVISRRCQHAAGPLLVLAGKGNNGGDGLVVARLAAVAGRRAEVVLLARPEELAPAAAAAYQRAVAAGVPVHGWLPAFLAERLEAAALVVDALLGTGSSGSPRGLYAAAIAAANGWRQGAKARGRRCLVALDVPSGLDADRGAAAEPTIRADLTVTFAGWKLGLLMGPARAYTGELWLAGIGIPDDAYPPAQAWLIAPESVRADLPPIDVDTHKGRRGRLWIVAGSRGMTGAAVLAARAGLRAGAGLVHVAVPEPERAIVAQAVPEALTLPLESTASGHIAVGALEALEAAVAPADAVVVGPGLGREDSVELLVTRLLERLPQPVVVDADALNALGPYPQPQRLGVTAGPRILTPHPGEAARLLATTTHQVQADRPRAARELARRTGAVVVLKGAHTLVAHPDGRLWINPTGSPALATGGSGDVLAGTIGALLAQGLAPEAAARAGVFLHGWAGQLLERRFGATGVVAGDIPAALARATRHLRQGAAGARLWAEAGLNVWGEGLGISTDLC